MHIHGHESGMSAGAGGSSGIKRIAKLKDVVSGIDWLLANNALTSNDTAEELKRVQRLLKQEIIMIDYGL